MGRLAGQGDPQWLSPTIQKVKAFLITIGESLDHPWKHPEDRSIADEYRRADQFR